jgi:hypothetical protein
MKASFTSFPANENWVRGICGKYIFEAKLFDEGSSFGINEGRVSKISIWSGVGYYKKVLVNYDRGWDIRPSDKLLPVYAEIMQLLETSPKRFENEF